MGVNPELATEGDRCVGGPGSPAGGWRRGEASLWGLSLQLRVLLTPASAWHGTGKPQGTAGPWER